LLFQLSSALSVRFSLTLQLFSTTRAVCLSAPFFGRASLALCLFARAALLFALFLTLLRLHALFFFVALLLFALQLASSLRLFSRTRCSFALLVQHAAVAHFESSLFSLAALTFLRNTLRQFLCFAALLLAACSSSRDHVRLSVFEYFVQIVLVRPLASFC
jgi:hypothetical protein